jgi:hypothetical protein
MYDSSVTCRPRRRGSGWNVLVVSRRTWFTFSAAISTSTAVGYLALVGVQIWFGRTPGKAAGLTLLPALLWVSAAVLLARSSWSGWMPSRRRQQVQAVLWAAMLGVVAALLLGAFSAPFAVAVGAVVAAVGLVAYRRTVTTAVDRNTRLPQSTSSVEGIDDLIAASRRQLDDPTMTAAQRAMVKFNLASALTDREAVGDDPGALLEAAGLLDELLVDPAVDLPTRSLVAMELCGTKSMLASITGSDEGWQDALDQMLAVARRLPDDKNGRSSLMRAHDEQAQFHMFHLSEIEPDLDGEMPPEWHEQIDAAIECIERALASAPDKAEMRPHLLMELGVFTGMRDPEAGLVLLREAFGQVRRHPLSRRQDVQLALAMQLVTRARLNDEDGFDDVTPDLVTPDLVEVDLAEAERLATELAERTELLNGQAAEVLAEISRLRAQRQLL